MRDLRKLLIEFDAGDKVENMKKKDNEKVHYLFFKSNIQLTKFKKCVNCLFVAKSYYIECCCMTGDIEIDMTTGTAADAETRPGLNILFIVLDTCQEWNTSSSISQMRQWNLK